MNDYEFITAIAIVVVAVGIYGAVIRLLAS